MAFVNRYRLRFAFIAALLLSSCATQPFPTAHEPPGFLLGVVHGFLSVLSLIGSLFWDIRVYAFPNSGRLYDLGFVIGAALFFGMAGRESEKYYMAGYAEGLAVSKARED